jgi:hypothetical protein
MLVVTFVLLSVNICSAQISNSEAEMKLRKDPCVERLRPVRPELLRIVRIEELEDRIFELQRTDRKIKAKAVYVFEVSTSGIFITPENEVINVSSQGMQSKLVAVSRQDGHTFALHGCENAIDHFSVLTKHAEIRIDSASDAESFMHLYYRLIMDPHLTRVIYTTRDISHEFENYFFSEFAESDAASRFQNWKRKFDKNSHRLKLGVSSVERSCGYAVVLTSIEITRTTLPIVKELDMFIDAVGAVKSINARQIY